MFYPQKEVPTFSEAIEVRVSLKCIEVRVSIAAVPVNLLEFTFSTSKHCSEIWIAI